MVIFIINLILALAGIYISWRIFQQKRVPSKMVCVPGRDCEDVLTSKFSKYFSVDIEFIGFVYYGVLFVGYLLLAIFAVLLNNPILIYALLLVSAVGLIFSIYLTLVQVLYIKNWCWWCLASAGTSVVIFVLSAISFSNFGNYGVYGAGIATILAGKIGTLLFLQLLGVAVGASAATISAVLVVKFLKDFRIDAREDKKLTILDQIIWLAITVLLLVNLSFYIIDPELYLNSNQFIPQLVVFGILILNNIILSLHISPKLIGIRIDLRSINVMRVFWLRQYALALGTVSIVSWYTVLFVGFFARTASKDIFEVISYYIAISIVAVILTQIAILIVDKIRVMSDNRAKLKFKLK